MRMLLPLCRSLKGQQQEWGHQHARVPGCLSQHMLAVQPAAFDRCTPPAPATSPAVPAQASVLRPKVQRHQEPLPGKAHVLSYCQALLRQEQTIAAGHAAPALLCFWFQLWFWAFSASAVWPHAAPFPTAPSPLTFAVLRRQKRLELRKMVPKPVPEPVRAQAHM